MAASVVKKYYNFKIHLFLRKYFFEFYLKKIAISYALKFSECIQQVEKRKIVALYQQPQKMTKADDSSIMYDDGLSKSYILVSFIFIIWFFIKI